MASTSTTVNFALTDDADSGDISLDDAYNRSFYELGETETKTVFAPEEIAFLKIIPGAASLPYVLGSNLGTLSLANSDVLFDFEEEIHFIISSIETLSHLPDGDVTYSWIGNDGGTPLFSGSLITITSDVIGILMCSYKTYGDRLKLSNAVSDEDEYDVLCVASYGDDNNISTTVGFSNDEVPTEVSLEVRVIDMCTGDPIPGATVLVEGFSSGITDEDGLFNPGGKILTGSSYDILVSAPDYVTSDIDFIKNDSFTVPIIEPEDEET